MKELAKKYKRQTASRYLPIGAKEINSKIIEAENYGVSKKYDGHFYLLTYDGETAELVNHGGNNITDLPLLKEATTLLKGKCKDVVFAGELYLYKENERTYSFDMTAALDDKSEDIYFSAFDILTFVGEKISLGITHLDKKLIVVLSGGKSLHAVKNNFVESRKDGENIYKQNVEEGGQEGIIVRAENGPTYKIKNLITLDPVILGYSEGEGVKAGMLKEMLVGLCVAKDQYIVLTKVGNGYSEQERKTLSTNRKRKK